MSEPKLGLFGLPEPTEEERAEFRTLELIEPAVGEAIARAMRLLERGGEVTEADRTEFREALKALQYALDVARVKQWGAQGQATQGSIRINGKTEFRFRPASQPSDVELIRFGAEVDQCLTKK